MKSRIKIHTAIEDVIKASKVRNVPTPAEEQLIGLISIKHLILTGDGNSPLHVFAWHRPTAPGIAR